jgi:hypothetical protein
MSYSDVVLLLTVPTIVGLIVMVIYGFWDVITGKEYYVDEDILGHEVVEK